jgi:hypothetical protein
MSQKGACNIPMHYFKSNRQIHSQLFAFKRTRFQKKLSYDEHTMFFSRPGLSCRTYNHSVECTCLSILYTSFKLALYCQETPFHKFHHTTVVVRTLGKTRPRLILQEVNDYCSVLFSIHYTDAF